MEYIIVGAEVNGKEQQRLINIENVALYPAAFAEKTQKEKIDVLVSFFPSHATNVRELGRVWIEGDTSSLADVYRGE